MTENTATHAELQARERKYRAELVALEEALGFPVRGAYSVGDRGVDVGVACVSLDDLRGLLRVRALPDRETIARAILTKRYGAETAQRAEAAAGGWYRSEWANALGEADAVLALFGQEGQR